MAQTGIKSAIQLAIRDRKVDRKGFTKNEMFTVLGAEYTVEQISNSLSQQFLRGLFIRQGGKGQYIYSPCKPKEGGAITSTADDPLATLLSAMKAAITELKKLIKFRNAMKEAL